MKTPEEILSKSGRYITPETRCHNYDYLYKEVVKAMEEYASQFKNLTCPNCGEEIQFSLSDKAKKLMNNSSMYKKK